MSLLELLRTEPSLRRPAIVVIVLITTTLLGERVLTAVFDSVLEGSSIMPMWLPQLGTIGKTVTFYMLLLDFLHFIAIPVTLMWLAYAYGRRTAIDPAQ